MSASLRTRLMAVYLGLVIVGFGGLTLLAGRQMASSAYDDFGSNLRIYALLLANQLVEPLDEGGAAAAQIIRDAAASLEGQVAIFDLSGRFVMSSDGMTVALVPTGPAVIQPNAAGEESVYVSVAIMGEHSQEGSLQLAVPAAVPRQAVRQRWLVLGAGFVAFSVLGLAVSLWLLITLTRPLAELQETARRMAEGDLSQRVATRSQDEIGLVGTAFNEMAERIETMVAEQRAFAGNASHELRTPLTTIRLRTEWLQSGELDSDTAQQYMAEIEGEVQRMARLVDDLLLLSQLDAQRLPAGEEQIDLVRLLRVLSQEYAPIAADKQIEFVVHYPGAPLPAVGANLSHARVVVRNVLDNALKYTPRGGHVGVSLERHEQMARLQVLDDGHGISAQDLAHVGDRFYRADKARSREGQGSGLGLALVRSVLRLYGGEMRVASAGLGQGTSVTIDWPIRGPAEDAGADAAVKGIRPA